MEDVTSPLLYPEGVDDAAIEKAVALARNIQDHISTHYGIFATQNLPRLRRDGEVEPSNFTALDLMHYHVYGDYRLVMAPDVSSNAPSYLKVGIPTTMLRYKTVTPTSSANPNIKANTDLNFLSDQMAAEEFDILHGVMGDRGTTPAETEWFVRELAYGNSAMKFHLPSLGTMAVTNYTFKNIADVLAKALAETLEQMMEAVDYNKRKLPAALANAFDADGIYGADHCTNDDLRKNPLLFQVAKAITLNDEYIDLAAQYPEVPIAGTIEGLARNAYRKESYYEAAYAFTKELLKLTSAVFIPGVPVTFKPSGGGGGLTPAQTAVRAAAPNYPEVIDGNMSASDAEALLLSESYVVVDSARISGKQFYDIATETEYGETFVIPGVPEVALQLDVGDLDKEQMVEEARKAGRKGPKKFTHPSLLVFQRVALDVIFSVEALLHVCAVPSKFFLLSPKINVMLKQAQAAKFYPYMADHITGEKYNNEFHKDAPALLEHLVTLRTQHTVANIANSDKLILDSRTMEEFYRQDLRFAEMMWLATALTEEGKVIYEKKDVPNLLAQMQYRAKGVDSSVDYTQAAIKPTSVFYQIDSPILKDVIIKYDEEFVKFTIQNAFMPKQKKDKKKGGGSGGGSSGGGEKQGGVDLPGLASAIWGSIERRASEIINRPGVKPHLLFDNLFKKMENLAVGSPYIRENFPAKWVGTNTATLLRSAPEVLGEDLDMQFYTENMDEYIRHLKLVYKSSPAVASAILTTITQTIVQSEGDIQTLRDSFLARVKSQASRPQIKGTDVVFDAYRTVIIVMRSEIDVPLKFREEYVAEKLDEEQKKRILNAFKPEGDKIVLPESHPEFKEKEIKVDEESALYGLPNPYDMPVPRYYPKAGEELNTANGKVGRYIDSLIGSPTDPAWPANGFQIAVGSGGLTATQSTDLKARLLDPATRYIVRDIDWKGAEKIWDGRERRDDRAHPSVVAHFRNTLGIEFDVDTPGYPTMRLEVVPSSNLADYSSILYQKYLSGKYNEADYVYIPAGGVFKNPGVMTMKKTSGGIAYTPSEEGALSEDLFTLAPTTETLTPEFEEIGSSFDSLSQKGTMIYKGDLDSLKRATQKEIPPMIELPSEEVDVPLPEPEDLGTLMIPVPVSTETEIIVPETELELGAIVEMEHTDDPEVAVEIAEDHLAEDPSYYTHMHEAGLAPELDPYLGSPPPAYSADAEMVAVAMGDVADAGNRLSTSVDLAASEFGIAAQRFESASENFGEAAQAYERATAELAKIPDALKEGLSQAFERLIAEVPPAYFDNPEALSDEEYEEAEEEVEEALESSPIDVIREYSELLFKDLPGLMDSENYNYKEFKSLKPLVAENQDVDLVAVAIKSDTKTKKQALNWVRNSFVTALTYYIRDESADPSMMDPKEKKEYYWRQRCMTAMSKAKNGDKTFLADLGITSAD